MTNNNNKQTASSPLSPEKYIKTRARTLRPGKCFVSAGWQEKGLVTLVVTRNHPNGNFTFGMFLVDLFCQGVKETFYVFNVQDQYHEFLKVLQEEEGIEECTYALAHNIIYGAVAYAQDLGIKPAKEFAITQFLLEEDDDRIELIDVEFGLSGMPAVFTLGLKNADEIIALLEKKTGPGGYVVIDR